MLKKLRLLLPIAVSCILLIAAGTGSGAGPRPVYYWVSHGSPSDPVWTYFLQGAEQWAKDTGSEVRTSFHSGDVPEEVGALAAFLASDLADYITGTSIYIDGGMMLYPGFESGG